MIDYIGIDVCSLFNKQYFAFILVAIFLWFDYEKDIPHHLESVVKDNTNQQIPKHIVETDQMIIAYLVITFNH